MPMKQKFDNAGVAYVQATILSLSTTDRAQETYLIRTDFTAWMTSKFDLHIHQQQQLQAMPATLRDRLAYAIAASYDNGTAVTFTKDTTEQDNLPDIKDVILIGIPDDTPIGTDVINYVDVATPVLIWIRYRH